MNLVLPILLFLVYGNFLCAELKDHFKAISDKSDAHTIKNIDFIYMINLDQRPEKFASCVKQLAPYGINPYRFSAVNGWELPLETINKLGVKYNPSTMKPNLMGTCYQPENNGKYHHETIQVKERNYFGHHMAHGTIGIVLSHLSVLYDAYKSNHKRIWVMEDDIEIKKDPNLLSSLIDELTALVGDGWDILFTDKDTKDKKGNYVTCLSYAPRPNFSPSDEGKFAGRIKVNEKFMRIGARYGAYSMIIQQSGITKILDFFTSYNIFLPYDMDFYLPEGIRMYTVIDDIVSTQPNALSDNGKPGYQQRNLCLK